MRTRNVLAAAVASLAFVGCASTNAAPNVTGEGSGSRGHWTGSLQPTQQRTGNVQATSQTRAFGTISIDLPTEDSRERMRVKLTVAMPTSVSTQIRWAVLPDRCGSGDLPVIGFEQFPLLEIGNNGRGEITAELPLGLTPNNVYHVNVYNGGQQLDNVFTCGNLKYENPKQ